MDRRNVQKVAQRARMVGMHEAGLSPHQIAADLGVHENTVYRWLKRWEEEGDLTDQQEKPQKRKIGDEQYQVCSGACIRRGTQWSRNL
ncbi:hypothetical protein Pcinc_006667 [Petrolisthes cinctipes]|uniref:Transposase n=1 Tax=Petrolisthes cinctipes TaxID=88211 RepID=A0AAE1GB11_PETCI|nr:hypothetical protein Pcinc_006667 [Petrolisthes cinctipes]